MGCRIFNQVTDWYERSDSLRPRERELSYPINTTQFTVWSSELLRRVVFWLYTNVSEENSALFFRIDFISEDGGSNILRNVGIQPEDHSLTHIVV
jgi:hypothetical protein